MSALAFNLNGEPFDVAPTAMGWRARRLKAKGAPEVIPGLDGTPLVLPIDADIDDLRREARVEGRYRLDQVDDQHRLIAGAPAAYVWLLPSDSSSDSPRVTRETLASQALPPGMDAVIEAMRIHSELARSVVDKFPMMLESAAVLVRAADGAGMPARAPRPFEIIEVDEEAEIEDGTAPELQPAKPGALAGFLDVLLQHLAPQVLKAVLGGQLQVPGGLGAILDQRRAVAGDVIAASSEAVQAVEPAPGRRVPASAMAGRASSRSTTTPAVGVRPRPEGQSVTPATPRSSSPATAVPENLPTLDAADTAHFLTIVNALTQREQMYARALASELSADDLRAWVQELKTLDVPDAVARIRGVLGAAGAADISAADARGAS